MTEEAYVTKVGQNQEEALSFVVGIFCKDIRKSNLENWAQITC